MIVGTVAGTLSSIYIVGSFAARALEREGGSSADAREGAGAAGPVLGSAGP